MADIFIGIFSAACVAVLFIAKIRAVRKIRHSCSRCKSCKSCAAQSEIDKNQICD